ncbi:HET-domain-containing protein [Westerdykella ornata]|uniref:HET-domain-containing protein n=1 Tax=Westerdykella ornata TaxID=318751 RepID=A0A6A6JIC7_WESOR|nr:HET-domain-containing protein [Westerdykella ornata]KAF2275964.1 HET-domain-containing protein [Westerdykella ornata]
MEEVRSGLEESPDGPGDSLSQEKRSETGPQNDVAFSYSEECPWVPADSPENIRIRLIELDPSPQAFARSDCKYKHLLWNKESPTNPKPDPLTCRISWHPLSTVKPFKALSYTWGESIFTKPIMVNGKKLLITPTLETALLHLRHSSEKMTLWIDQICIDQRNDSEKTEQVKEMGRIYRAADEVLVWLGPAADNSDAFMDVWRRVGKRAEDWGMMGYYTRENFPTLQRIMGQADPEDVKTREFLEILRECTPLFTLPVLEGMAAWYARPWFTRVWVLQEFGLAAAPTFICGDRRVTGDQALLAAQIVGQCIAHCLEHFPNWPEDRDRVIALVQSHDPVQPFFAARQRRMGRDIGTGTGDSLYQLLQKLFVDNRMFATVSCDTIYGVLGIANDAEDLKRMGIEADYSLKDRPDLVFMRTTRAILQKGDVDVLALSQYPKRLRDALPSWVPDWTSSIQRSFAWQATSDLFRFYSACKGKPLELTETNHEKVLGLKGFRVDVVEDVAGIWNIAGEAAGLHEKRLTYLAQIRLLCRLSHMKDKPIYPSLSRRLEAIWRIPIGDIEEDNIEGSRRATQALGAHYETCLRNLEHFEQWKAYTQTEFQLKHKVFEQSELRHTSGMYRLCMDRMTNKRPFITKDGYVGLGPRCMTPGDVVVVFCGATIPYVIRPMEEGSFRFIGECYCDGIMDGEIVDQRSKEDKEDFLLV